MDRRSLLAASAATAATLGAPTSLPAQAFVDVASQVLSGNIGLGFLTLIEKTYTDYEFQQQLNGLTSDMKRITEHQTAILRAFESQRVIMREEIRRGFLEREIYALNSRVSLFQSALRTQSESREAMLREDVTPGLSELALTIAGYGAPAMPAFMVAVNLDNIVKAMLSTSSDRIRATNETYRGRLHHMLNGSGPGGLPALMASNRDSRLSAIPTSSQLLRFGRRNPIWVAGEAYSDASILQSATVYGFQYEGMRNGRPYQKLYSERRYDVPNPAYRPNIAREWYNVVAYYDYGYVTSKTSLALNAPYTPSLPSTVCRFDGDRPGVTSDGYPILRDEFENPHAEMRSAIDRQRLGVNQYYMDVAYLVFPELAKLEITRATYTGEPTEGQINMRTALRKEIASLDRVISLYSS